MHSKTHFKFSFKSSKISTVSIKNIFFLNTRLPKEHYQIYFTIFEATKLEIQLLQNSIEIWNICTILLLNGHWQAGPTRQRGPRVSDKKTGDGSLDGAATAKLTDGHNSGEANGTGAFLATIRTYPYPFLDRYHALAMTASAMADGGEVAAGLRRRRAPIAPAKLSTSFTGSR